MLTGGSINDFCSHLKIVENYFDSWYNDPWDPVWNCCHLDTDCYGGM